MLLMDDDCPLKNSWRMLHVEAAATSSSCTNQLLVEVSPDIHICGFCKQQFTNVILFFTHKQNCCKISTQNPGAIVFSQSSTKSEEELPQSPEMPLQNLETGTDSKKAYLHFLRLYIQNSIWTKGHGETSFNTYCRRDKLNLHSRLHTGEKPHKCKYCPYAAADSSSLKKHLRIHYDERPFKCQICSYASRNSSQLTVHLRSHTGDAPFQCNQCDAKFKINSDLKRHSRVHSGEKPYKCELCEYRCAIKANLKSHIHLKHSSSNSFRCSKCDFQCSSKAALRLHSRQHQPAKPLQCSQCSYSSYSKGALKTHERVHSDERPFKCELCSFASKQRSNLLMHTRKCHSDKSEKSGRGSGTADESSKLISKRYRARLEAARGFRCDACEASFVREDSLRSHMRQHNDTQQSLQTSTKQPETNATNTPQSYTTAHLKIIVAPSLGPETTFVHTSTSKSGAVVIAPESHNVILNPTLHHVNMLAPENPLEQTVLLTQINPDVSTTDTSTPDFINCSGPPSEDMHTFITSCSDLESLHKLIQEGGTEVTVVTVGDPIVASTKDPLNNDDSSSGMHSGDIMVDDGLDIGPSEAILVQSIPLSPHQLFSDSGMVDITDP
ncbi:hypothetical protein DNTS_026194 [Danionella cerebrum]|uniref:C2H2-type domain-containing protein n=1 Tax=Danionella cerebrum TaxID=2873325 RepID=A0A553R0F9_9TELE|nr:hypothetical protein DNTS_026194 [Danionella translucida]